MPDATPQRIVPMLAYSDARSAIRFLCEAFGFEERYRMDMPDGSVGHAEIALDDNVVMLATAWTAAGMASPFDLAGVHSQLHCRVDDVDSHYARARANGATLIDTPQDQPHGERSYRAVDPEGHRWVFGSPLPGAASEGH